MDGSDYHYVGPPSSLRSLMHGKIVIAATEDPDSNLCAPYKDTQKSLRQSCLFSLCKLLLLLLKSSRSKTGKKPDGEKHARSKASHFHCRSPHLVGKPAAGILPGLRRSSGDPYAPGSSFPVEIDDLFPRFSVFPGHLGFPFFGKFQPADGIGKVVFGGQVTDEEVESLLKRSDLVSDLGFY